MIGKIKEAIDEYKREADLSQLSDIVHLYGKDLGEDIVVRRGTITKDSKFSEKVTFEVDTEEVLKIHQATGSIEGLYIWLEDENRLNDGLYRYYKHTSIPGDTIVRTYLDSTVGKVLITVKTIEGEDDIQIYVE